MDLLCVKNLSVQFKDLRGRVHAVQHVDFSVPANTTVGIVGESGCGKSVTSLAVMNLIGEAGGMIPNGEIWFEGVDLLKRTDKQMCAIRGARMAMIFQDPTTALNPSYTVYQQINEVYKKHGAGSRSKGEIAALLARLNITNPERVVKQYPFELSGGMRQRLVIAMAIALQPVLLIADEPTTALDVITQAEILEQLRAIRETTDSSILLITHDLGVIAEMAQRVMVMYQGQVVEESDVLRFFDQPLHPYTQGLLKAQPAHFDGRFVSIPGAVETAYADSVCCSYAPRCKSCMEICQQKAPPTVWTQDQRRVACWQYAKEKPNGAE